MEHTRVTISLPKKMADELRRFAGPRGMSAYVAEALVQPLQASRLRVMLDEMEQEVGPIPPEVQEEVDRFMWPDDYRER